MFSRVLRKQFFRLFFLLGAVLPLAAYALVTFQPSAAAQVADSLRLVLGNEGVAELETVVFQVQDAGRRLKFGLGLEEAQAPWHAVPAVAVVHPVHEERPGKMLPPPVMTSVAPTPAATATARTDLIDMSPVFEAPTPLPTAVSTATPEPPTWMLPALEPLGTLPGEGAWSPYIMADEIPVALRTFLQPDAAERPFAVAAVVAFDLTHTNLSFVLGSQEPAVPGGPHGTGNIAAANKVPGVLLATFNGGFKATHGQFGAVDNGIRALPPKNGYGSLVIYADGHVEIGEWGKMETDDIISIRQNARLVVQDGAINPRVYNDSMIDWGGTIDNQIVTWRSGIGIDAAGETLYYFAGPSLSMPALADAMLQVGVEQGMLLDINASWVHFTAVHGAVDGQLVADPLFAKEMASSPDRYLRQSTRDFFYITLKPDVALTP